MSIADVPEDGGDPGVPRLEVPERDDEVMEGLTEAPRDSGGLALEDGRRPRQAGREPQESGGEGDRNAEGEDDGSAATERMPAADDPEGEESRDGRSGGERRSVETEGVGSQGSDAESTAGLDGHRQGIREERALGTGAGRCGRRLEQDLHAGRDRGERRDSRIPRGGKNSPGRRRSFSGGNVIGMEREEDPPPGCHDERADPRARDDAEGDPRRSVKRKRRPSGLLADLETERVGSPGQEESEKERHEEHGRNESGPHHGAAIIPAGTTRRVGRAPSTR